LQGLSLLPNSSIGDKALGDIRRCIERNKASARAARGTWDARKRYLLAGSLAFSSDVSAPHRLKHVRVELVETKLAMMVCAAAVRMVRCDPGIGGHVLRMLGSPASDG
jgi:hypothetical protein